MSTHICPTIVLTNKNGMKKPQITSSDQLGSKFNAGKNTQSAIPYAAKIEKAVEDGTAGGPPKIPREVSQQIQSKRIEMGFKTQKELANSMNSPPITVNELQQMENGQMILTPQNRPKVQAVGRKLNLGPLNLPKFG